jgi:hypothetical protein
MDILAHGLWAYLAFKAANMHWKKKEKLGWAVFWGMFPDLFGFTIPILIILFGLFAGTASIADIPKPGHETEVQINGPLPHMLYNYSHSLIIFALVALAAWGIMQYFYRKTPWVLGGWLLHILMDIPTHSKAFYPTPILWPLSTWTFDGVMWGQLWFMILNYALLAVVYFYLKHEEKSEVNRKRT